jgi:hypothetical protein
MRPSVARPNALIRWLVSTRVCHRDDACSDVRPFIGQRSSSVAESARPVFTCHPKRRRSGIGENNTSLQRVKRQQEKKYRRRRDVVLASLLTSSRRRPRSRPSVFKRGQSDERANERKEDPRGSGWKRPHIRGSLVKVAHARECTRMRPHERASAHTGQRVPSVCSACCPQRVQRVGWRVGGGAKTPQRGDSAAASPFDTPLKYAISTFRPLKRPRNDPVPLPYREVPPSVGIAQRAGKRPSWTVSSSGSRIGAKETSRIRTPRVSR